MDFRYRLFRSKQEGQLVVKVLDLDFAPSFGCALNDEFMLVSNVRALPSQAAILFDGSRLPDDIELMTICEIACQLLAYGWEVARSSNGQTRVLVLRDVPAEAVPALHRHLKQLELPKMRKIEVAFRYLLLEGQAAWRAQYGAPQRPRDILPLVIA